jgi:hypothetical protein
MKVIEEETEIDENVKQIHPTKSPRKSFYKPRDMT